MMYFKIFKTTKCFRYVLLYRSIIFFFNKDVQINQNLEKKKIFLNNIFRRWEQIRPEHMA